jgi:hypothetical protein
MGRGFVGILLLASVLMASAAHAQAPLGTFRWQLEPHCNIVSVTVTQSGGVYRLEGTDDQCGAGGDLASAIGTAFLNPDGSVGLGLNVVSTPGGAPVHVDATISVASLSGSWRDSAGNSGNLVFRTGAGSGGSPRPQGGTIGAVAVNPKQVQLRIGGVCPAGSFMLGVGQEGSVSCAPELGDITGVLAGDGLEGGIASGLATLKLATSGAGAFSFDNVHGFVASGNVGEGNLPFSGPGTRVMWYPGKAAFRAGTVAGTQWDDVSVGKWSVAFGANTVAVGPHAFAVGDNSSAVGGSSIAMGTLAHAAGAVSVAVGWRVNAMADSSIVLGSDAVALPEAGGSIILSDRSSTNKFTSFAPNEFLVRSAGGAGIYTNPSTTAGVELAPGGSAWLSVSDVNMKENFRDLDDADVLAKIARMPVREWNYKAQEAAIRHVGPTAQDFHAAFGLGEDPLRISTIDADGIALAGVKALEARTQALADENRVLRERLDALERRIGHR